MTTVDFAFASSVLQDAGFSTPFATAIPSALIASHTPETWLAISDALNTEAARIASEPLNFDQISPASREALLALDAAKVAFPRQDREVIKRHWATLAADSVFEALVNKHAKITTTSLHYAHASILARTAAAYAAPYTHLQDTVPAGRVPFAAIYTLAGELIGPRNDPYYSAATMRDSSGNRYKVRPSSSSSRETCIAHGIKNGFYVGTAYAEVVLSLNKPHTRLETPTELPIDATFFHSLREKLAAAFSPLGVDDYSLFCWFDSPFFRAYADLPQTYRYLDTCYASTNTKSRKAATAKLMPSSDCVPPC